MENWRKKREKGRERGGRETYSEQLQNLIVNWMTNCIGFVNLTTGRSDRGLWHWLAMLCPTNHNNTSPVMSQMWNNQDSLRYVWCHANSCSNLGKAQHRATSDQMRWEKSQRVYYCSSTAGWKRRRHTDLLWFIFMTVSVTDFFGSGWDHWEECL